MQFCLDFWSHIFKDIWRKVVVSSAEKMFWITICKKNCNDSLLKSLKKRIDKQDLVSTMLKIGWSIFPCFLWCAHIIEIVWYDLIWKRVSPLDVIIRMQTIAIVLCIGPFSAWRQINKQTNTQTPNWVILEHACSWSITTERAVFCNLLNLQTKIFATTMISNKIFHQDFLIYWTWWFMILNDL